MVAIVTVNRHVIAANKKKMAEGLAPDAPFSVRYTKHSKPVYAVSVTFPEGAELVYNPDEPLKCGATVWIEASEVVLDV